jgi:hypothetical protein
LTRRELAHLLGFVLGTGLTGCVTHPQFDLRAVSSRLHSPAIVKQSMARFDTQGARGFPPPDPAILGRWINRVGYKSDQRISRVYRGDGNWRGEGDNHGDFFTLQADGLHWLYEVARFPDGSVSGRSLRIYLIDGDQMLARFQRRYAGWEFWERSTAGQPVSGSGQ